MKKIVTLFLCLFLLTSCKSVNVTVAPKNDQEQLQTVSVTVCGPDETVVFSNTTEYYDGVTALDILIDGAKEKNIAVFYSGDKSSAYITSIGGLEEKQHNEQGGWIYTVNGESVMKPSGKCILSPGDKVEWKYITEF